MGGVRRHWLNVAALVVLVAAAPLRADTVIDDFETPAGWSAWTSDPGVKVELASDQGPSGMAMRVDFTFEERGGHVFVRKAVDLDLPANYAFTFAWRGASPPIDVEFKLVDRAEKNVWWYRLLETTPPTDWTTVRIKKPRLEFAWGPASGGPPRNIAFIELALTGAVGDRGSLWIDDLRLVPRPPPPRASPTPAVSASTAIGGHEPKLVLDDAGHTSWHSGTLAQEQWLLLDFGTDRELGGLVIEWDSQDYALAYDVELSSDGQTWATVYRSTRGNGHRDNIFLPDAEARFVRISMHESSRAQGYAINSVRVVPLELAASPNQFVAAIARESQPDVFPRYFAQLQSYWTVLGVSGDGNEALLANDGMLEPLKGSFSIQPFLYVDGALVSWRNAQISQELEDRYLPIPSVTWGYEFLNLKITAVATGAPNDTTLLARYRIDNSSAATRDITLFLAVWPFQVLPPWQTLNMTGGVSPIHDLVFDARTLWVNRRTAVIAMTPPAHVGASTADEGPIADFLIDGILPERTQVTDPYGFASAAMQFDIHLPPGGQQDVFIAVPYYDPDAASARASTIGAQEQFDRAFEAAKRDWRRLLGCVDFLVPPSAQPIVDAVRTTVAHSLLNRNGPALQPGPRTYSRSWIRDGAMIGAALLEMGFSQEIRDFLRWYAAYQYPDGKIPCCVDKHGADSLPEHDSNGEFLYAIAEYYRYTHDIGFVSELWPPALQAVRFLETLRAQRLTDEYQKPNKRAFRGLLPESVSHEGYVARPVHSYWDDFFALRGLKDALMLADAYGDTGEATRIAAMRDALQQDIHASIAAVIADRKLEYVPASVELADFDPSSTAIALRPAGEMARLPRAQLERTFDRYYEEFSRRRRGEGNWELYSPYELRNVGALLRLGRRDQAMDVLLGILADRRPLAWNQWPEVIWRDADAPKFIGDMPHTWIGAGYIDAVRDLFAYEREDDAALVLAAGIPAAWLSTTDDVGVRRLPTHYGILSYTLRREADNALRCHIFGDVAVPDGGLVLVPPLPGPLRAVTVNGEPAPFEPDQVRIRQFPVDALLEY